MPRTRPPYPAAFRQQILELTHTGRTPAELSREFNVTAQTIANWVAQDARDRGEALPDKQGLTTAEREELVRLRRKLRQMEQERDIRGMGSSPTSSPWHCWTSSWTWWAGRRWMGFYIKPNQALTPE